MQNILSFPVGVQLFNRPEYAKKMLVSLKNQSVEIPSSNLYIYIDGFKGSMYEQRDFKDETEVVESIAREIFPRSRIVRFNQNLGIADLRNRLQHEVFATEATWGVFFEEDVVLGISYIQELSDLISIVNNYPVVAKVACFQILNSYTELFRGYDGFYIGYGTQAVAERRSFFEAKQNILLSYIQLISSNLTDYGHFSNADFEQISQ